MNIPTNQQLQQRRQSQQAQNILERVVEGLQAPPFGRTDLNPVKLDSMSPAALLQTLSDVLCWIQGVQKPENFIDIRSEGPDETALRVLSTLRVLRYPPPRDLDRIQKWRLDIVEGQRSTILPILGWLFDNVDRLKERIYLAQFLTRIEVPLEAQSPETNSLAAMIELKMNEFKALHSRIVDSRMDHIRALEIHNDLKAMREEKEQLERRIERCKRRLSRVPDLQRLLDLARQIRQEKERGEELRFQRDDLKQTITHLDQRLGRLERRRGEEEQQRLRETPAQAMARLRRETEVNRFMVEEKLEADLAAQQRSIEAVRRVLALPSTTRSDIGRMRAEIERLSTALADLTTQRDRKDEQNGGGGDVMGRIRSGSASADSLSVYRHQAANVQRRKANVADQLQAAMREHESLQTILGAKKRELAERTGADEVVTTVQYKLYVNELRQKNTVYRARRHELDELRAEVQILERTIEILKKLFDEVKAKNIAEGRIVVEGDFTAGSIGLHQPQQRPKTAKPKTRDVEQLLEMIEKINGELEERRDRVQQLNADMEKFYREHKERNEAYEARKLALERDRQTAERELTAAEERVKRLAEQLVGAETTLEQAKETMERQQWLFEQARASPEQIIVVVQQLERQHEECQQQIQRFRGELTDLAGRSDLAAQKRMWANLVAVFEAKLRVARGEEQGGGNKGPAKNARPIGDKIF